MLPKERISETAGNADKRVKAIRFILAAKLFSAPYAKDYDLRSLMLTDETHIAIVDYIVEREQKRERIRPSELFEILQEECLEFNAVLDLNYGDKLSGEIAERFFFDSVKTLEREQTEREINALNARYVAETDEEKKKEIAKRLVELMQKKKRK